MNQVQRPRPNGSQTEQPVYFLRADGSRLPYKVYSPQELYDLEQERIFRGPVWSFVGLEAEIPTSGDFKSTFVGDTPVVVTRNDDSGPRRGSTDALIGARLSVAPRRGNAKSRICAYHQWSYETRGNLRGVPFCNGVKGSPGMPSDFDPKDHGLQAAERVTAIYEALH